MSGNDAEREYIRKACENLLVGEDRKFFADVVSFAFPATAPVNDVSEGYQRSIPGRTTYQQLHDCLNYGRGLYSIKELPGVYEVYRTRSPSQDFSDHETNAVQTDCAGSTG